MMNVLPSRMPRRLLGLGLLLAILLSQTVAAGPTLGEPILGGRMLVANDGYVTAEFLGSDAGYFNSLYLESPVAGARFIFDRRAPLDQGPISLGEFSAGTELIFRLDVRNTGLSFFTGDADRNDDGLAHALATTIVDEAGTASTPKLAALARLADQYQWRVVLVGDPRQFSAVGRGGMFGHLVDNLGQ